jgi:ubiquinone/menaquinone biosynthesis C-methylase UbiE
MIADALRSARTAALRLASPFDRAWRLATGRAHLPPLWLRRHTGAVSAFESAARETAAFLDRLDLLHDARLVLDVGCGAGAMVEEFARRLPEDGRYVGFDVHAPSIRWCRKRWAGVARLSFELAPVASPYGSAAGAPASSYCFPAQDGSADLVLAKSVFTHLLAPDARHYLSETRRVLRPGRAAVVTAFLFEENAPGVGTAFPFAASDGVRVKSRARPTAAVAWEKPRFVRMIEESGLRLQWHSQGYYPGRERLTAQDVLLLGH